MLVHVVEVQRNAILGSMKQIALVHGRGAISDTDVGTIDAAAQIVFGAEEFDVGHLPEVAPDELRAMMLSASDAQTAVRMLAVMSLVDGRLDGEKTELVAEYARAVDVDEEYLRVLAEAVAGEVAAAGACMIRKNAESFPSRPRPC